MWAACGEGGSSQSSIIVIYIIYGKSKGVRAGEHTKTKLGGQRSNLPLIACENLSVLISNMRRLSWLMVANTWLRYLIWAHDRITNVYFWKIWVRLLNMVLVQRLADAKAKSSPPPVVVVKEFYWRTAHVHLFVYILSTAAFNQQQSWVIAREMVCPTKLNIFMIWTFIEKIHWLLLCCRYSLPIYLSWLWRWNRPEILELDNIMNFFKIKISIQISTKSFFLSVLNIFLQHLWISFALPA